MKYTKVAATLAALALTLTSLSSFAQGRRQDPPQDRPQDRAQMERGAQDRDRDRTQDRDRLTVPSQDRDRGRDQDRTHAPDFAGLHDQDIYGNEVMTVQERNEYRKRLKSANSTAERKRVEAQHRATVQARAKTQGIGLANPGRGIYGGAIMSVEERNQYREQLRLMDSDADKEKFMAKHREQMQMRARAQGIDAGELEETD